jgi:two-component system response regulator PilR (NtrC family)
VNVIGVTVPTLSERRSDIPELVSYILIRTNDHADTGNKVMDTKAMEALTAYPFPGNVRELENILERATALCENNLVTVDDLQLPRPQPIEHESNVNLVAMTENIEKEQIKAALEDHRWNQSATARSLGITLRQLRYKIEKLKLNKI